MRLQVSHEVNKNNTGDIQSCFLEHFDVESISLEQDKVEVKTYDLMNESKHVNPDIPIIIGGGGMLINGRHSVKLKHIIDNHRSQVILWGIGVNNDQVGKNDQIPEWIKKASLIGIRDFDLANNNEISYVPCVSCMHPSFDIDYEIKNDVVCFEGNKLGLPLPTQCCLQGRPMEEIISFLGSANTIVTSSYHGMYWGTLLKKEVIVIPNNNSSKFHYFPVDLPHATINNWEDFIDKGKTYDTFLKECRSININFAEKVQDILKIELKPKIKKAKK